MALYSLLIAPNTQRVVGSPNSLRVEDNVDVHRCRATRDNIIRSVGLDEWVYYIPTWTDWLEELIALLRCDGGQRWCVG